MHRILIFGGPGSGTTDVGLQLANLLGVRFFDSDSFLWKPSKVPYSERASPEERCLSLKTTLAHFDGWVLSGSVGSWADFLKNLVTATVLLDTPLKIRRERIVSRDIFRFGPNEKADDQRLEKLAKLLALTEFYEVGDIEERRSRTKHLRWMHDAKAKSIIVKGDRPVFPIVYEILAEL
jgi:adenylate kinase family enzyme